jgi:hypothetical protein
VQTRIIAIASGVLLLVAGAFYWWWSQREVPEPAATPPAATEAPASAPSPEAVAPVPSSGEAPVAPALPSLDESDPFVRAQLLALSERLGDWLVQDDLVRRFAVVVENATAGELPRRQLAFLTPAEKYPVREENGRIFVEPAGYARYDAYVDTVLSVPPEQAAALLRTLAPLLRQALGELGQQRPDPIAAVKASIRQALQTPELGGEIELVQPKVLYKYADPTVEALPPLQKQLLRMGPANLARVKAYLREVQGYL